MIELTNSTMELLRGKKVYLYGNNARYIEDLKRRFPEVYSCVSGVIEENPRYREIRGAVSIFSIEEFNNKALTDAAIIILDDYYQEAFERASKSLNDVDSYFYFLDDETRLELEWKNKYANVPLEKLILFRSGPHSTQYVKGADFADNALAVFEYMIANGYNKEYKLVWFVKNPDEFSSIADEYENVEFVSFDWNISEEPDLQEKYFRYLFTAKYILFTDAYGFARNCRPEQIRIQLWHGCGFKTRTNFVPCEKRYEYNIVISELYKRIHADIYGLRDDQVVITGYPKSDWLFNPCDLDTLHGLDIPRTKKYIFWLPTFRTARRQLSELNEEKVEGEIGLPIIEKREYIEAINARLKENDIVLVIKPHPFQDEAVLSLGSYSNIRVISNNDILKAGLQINQLLGYADALISDYSSVATEYMLLDRPIAFTLDDVREYETSRGFVFDPIYEYLPGKEIWKIEDLFEFIDEISSGLDSTLEKRRELLDKMHLYTDGNSCNRFVEWMVNL